MRRPSPRRVMWVSGIAWIVSWSCLGLEIFYWHHVTKTLHLNPPKVPPGHPKPRPGHFLLSVLAGSALACGVPRRRHRDAGGQVAQAAAKAHRRGGGRPDDPGDRHG